MIEEKISLEKYTKTTLEEKGIFLKKSLGQNFLINQNIIDRIIEVSEVNKNDIVIEIGPGIGALTKSLVMLAAHVIAIEIDDRFIDVLNKELNKHDNFTVVHNDVLKLNLDELIEETIKKIESKTDEDETELNKQRYNIKVVANLPYYISTPVLIKLIESKKIEKIYIMLQKELAERFLAQTGTRASSSITYYISYYTDIKKEIDISKNNFKPVPKVDSQVISLKKREYFKKAKNEEILFKLIQIGFMQRRKTYLNNIKNFSNSKNKSKSKEDLSITTEKIEKIFIKLNIPITIRAEEITLDQYIEITNLV